VVGTACNVNWEQCFIQTPPKHWGVKTVGAENGGRRPKVGLVFLGRGNKAHQLGVCGALRDLPVGGGAPPTD